MQRGRFVSLAILIVLLVAQLPLFLFVPSVYAATAFSTVNLTSVHTCPLDTHTFVIAYSDDTNDDFSFQIWDTNGTIVLAETDVDTTSGASLTYTSIGVSAFNSTTFVIGWYDAIDYDATFAVYNTAGSLLSGPTDADTDVGSNGRSVQVSCFNSTYFVIGWYDYTDLDATFAVYTSSSVKVAGPIDVDTDVGSASMCVSVSTFNSTTFVIGWYDETDFDATFAIYNSAGTQIGTTIDADDDVGDYAYAVSVSTLNSTHFVIGWIDITDQDATFAVYDSSGTLKTGPIDADSTMGTASRSLQVSALNNTAFVISWYDYVDFDLSFATYLSDGTAVAALTDIESWPTAANTPFRYESPCSQETANNIKIYGDNWIIAYANTTTQAIWKAFKPDGTAWDGLPVDITPPTYSLPSPSYNTAIVGQPCTFSCLWADEINMSGFIFGTNNTGSWTNETWTNTWSNWQTTTSAWANMTKTLNATAGVVQYEWWANDTSTSTVGGNWNNTGIQSVTTFVPQLCEFYSTGDDSDGNVLAGTWKAQTFTVNATGHSVTSVKLKLYRVGSPSTVTVGIRTTDGTHPTGSDLTNGTIDGNTLNAISPGQWYTITLMEYTLTINTKYAIVVRATNGNATNYVNWRYDSTSDYANGNFEYSSNSGGSWTSTDYDSMFEVWGRNLSPTYSSIGANMTLAAQLCLFYAKWAGVSLSGYTFSWSNGSAWQSDNWQSWAGSPMEAWSNVTKTLPAPDKFVQYKFYANSSGGAENTTTIQSFITTSTFNFSNLGTNTTLSNNIADFHVFLNDTTYNLDWCGFQWDYPDGVYGNFETVWNDKGAKTSWANISKTLTSDFNVTIWYRFKINNTQGWEFYATDQIVTTWTADRYPSYNATSASTARPNQYCTFSSTWTSPNGLIGYIFSFNDGTGWANDTYTLIDGSPTSIVISAQQYLPWVDRRITWWTFYVKDGNQNWEHVTSQVHVVTGSHIVKYLDSSADWAQYSARLAAQKKTIYWGGRHWIFSVYNYTIINNNDIGDFGYSSSANGVSWTEITEIVAGTPYSGYSAFYDLIVNDTGYIHLVYAPSAIADVRYQTGQMYSNGTIIFNEVQIIYVYTNEVYYVADPFIILDSNEYPWITTMTYGLTIVGGTTNETRSSYVFASTSSNGTWVMKSGMPQLLYTKYWINVTGGLPVYWSIPVPLDNIYFITSFSQAEESYIATYGDPSLPLLISYWNLTSNTLSSSIQLSELKIGQQGFCLLSAIALNNTKFAYAYTTGDWNVRYGEWENGVVTEIELWHNVWHEAAEWYADSSSPILIYDNETNFIFVMAASVYRHDEIVFKRKDLNINTWSSEIVMANEKEVGMAKACSMVSGWYAKQYILGLLYTTVDYLGDCNLRYFYVNTTSLLIHPTYSNIGTNGTFAYTNIQFYMKWESDSGLKTAYFYWNWTGTLELNGTINLEGQVQAWSNFTGYLQEQDIVWKIVCEDVYGNLVGIDFQFLNFHAVRGVSQTISVGLSSALLLEWIETAILLIGFILATGRLTEFYFTRSLSQTISVTLNGQRLIDVVRPASQAIALALQGIGQKITIYLIDAILTITTSLQASRLAEWFVAVSQSISMMFVGIRLTELAKTASLTILLSLVGSRLIDVTRLATRNLGFSTVTSRLAEFIRSISQTLNIGFTVMSLAEFSRSVSQSLTVTLNVQRLIEVTRLASQALTFSFQTIGERVGIYARNAVLTITLSLQGSRLTEWLKAVTQSVSFTLETLRLGEWFRSTIQTITASLSANRLLDMTRTATEAFTLSLVGSRMAEFVRNASQTFNVGFGIIRIGEFFRSVSQTVNAVLNEQRLVELVRLVSQTVTFTLQSVGERVGIYIRNVALTIATSLQGSRLAEWIKSASQTFTVGFAVASLADFARSASQTIATVLNGERMVDLLRSASQTITLTLQTIGERVGIYLRNVAITITTAFQGSRLAEWIKATNQTISVTLGNTRLAQFVRSASQSIVLSLAGVGEKIGIYLRNVLLTITATLNTNRLTEATRQATQTLTLSLSTTRIAEFLALVVLTITTAFNANRLIELTRQASQSLNFLLNGERLIEVSRSVSQTITLTLQTIGEKVGDYFRYAILDANFAFTTLAEVPAATILLALAIALIVVACVVTYAIAKTQTTEKD